MKTITLIGAGGKMGCRLTDNFLKTDYKVHYLEVSPKGLDSFRVISPNEVVYLDLTGSGNETAAHVRADGRLTIMFCAFQGAPLILRLYGQGRSVFRGDASYADLLAQHFHGEEPAGARQIVLQQIDLVQTSCGFGVPLYQYESERPSLPRWRRRSGGPGPRKWSHSRSARHPCPG